MRLTIILMIVASLKVTAGASAQTVSLSAKKVPIEWVFSAVKTQTGYLFFYDKAILRDAVPVTVKAQNEPLTSFLTTVFKGQPLDYTIKDKTIFVRKLEQVNNIAPPAEAQQQPVTGTVRDASGVPLIGVTLKIKNGNTGAITNTEGKFTIDAKPGDVLVVTFIGFEPQEKTVGSSGNADITLQTAVSALNEMVIVGYGATSKRNNTGSVSSVKAADIASSPVTDPLAALQGRVPGVQITASNGVPGSAFNVVIRGQNSVLKANQPLYIIDGVPFFSEPLNSFTSANGRQSPLATINPADIERIDILKDADATSIYGSRGANGVILITTKKGSAGKTQTTFNVYTGASKVVNRMDMLTTPEYIQLRKEGYKNDNKTYDEETAPDLLLWDQQKTTDWQKMMIGNTGHITEAQGSVSGGNAQTQFRLSGTYHKETTVMPGKLGFERGAGNLSITHSNANGKFRINGVISYSANRDNSVAASLTAFTATVPNYPLYDDTGNYYWIRDYTNPMATLQRKSEMRTNNLVASSEIKYTLLPGLDLKANIGYTKTDMNHVQTFPAKALNPFTANGSYAQYGYGDLGTYNVEPQVNYTTTISKGTLQVMAGATWQQSLTKKDWIYGDGYSSDAMLENIKAAGQLISKDNLYALYKYNAVFGRINYNWEEKYLLNVTFRRDGSTRFGPGNRFGNFGAVGAAWVFSKESFIPEGSVLSFGKLRASMGTSGNDQIGDYQFLDSWEATSYPYDGVPGLTPARLANPDFQWEVSRKKEVALELGFFKDRILLTTNYYHNISDNQLLDYQLTPQVGFGSINANFPAKVLNAGWEFELNTTNIQRKDFTWKSGLNLTANKNELKEFPGIESSTYKNVYVVGKSLSIVKGFQFLNVDPETGLAMFQSSKGPTATPAENDDYVILGKTAPEFFGGLYNSFTWKGISLDFLFQFVKQEGGAFNYGYGILAPGTANNLDRSALDRWQQKGDITNVPKATSGTNAANIRSYNLSSYQWGDASYIRLKNLSLRYDLSRYTHRWKVNNVSVYALAQNLFTITNYDGYDPETRGLAMPPLRTYTLGLQLSL